MISFGFCFIHCYAFGLLSRALHTAETQASQCRVPFEYVSFTFHQTASFPLTCRVEDAVKDAMSNKAAGKRKVEEPGTDLVVKRVRIFGILEEDDEESGGEDEGPDKDGPSGVAAGDGVGSSHAPSDEANEGVAQRDEKKDAAYGGTDAGSAGDQEKDSNAGAAAEAVPQSAAAAAGDGKAKDFGRPLDFSMFGSAQEMEALGLERLKEELQDRGLKCGGSVSERAARLFLLKSTPLEKLDKKLFAKAPASKKGT